MELLTLISINNPSIMSANQFNHGGQRRTATIGCGYTCRGHPVEVEKKIKMHFRHCATCKELGIDKNEIPKFNKTAGNVNGWGGMDAKGNMIDRGLSTIISDGNAAVVKTEGRTAQERIEDAHKILLNMKLKGLL